jgi:CheY-like chemotaxis protein
MAKAETLRGILLIEDNPDDVEATQRAFKKAGLANPVHWCSSGQDGIDFLTCFGKYAPARSLDRPALILLDLNMPGIDGRAILEIIKQNTELRHIPVLILTTSTDARDIDRCYELGASTYIQKPVDFEGLVHVASRIRDYWFGMALLPHMPGEEKSW